MLLGGRMEPTIIFLGTGGYSYVVGRQLRGAGGIILQIGENQFHIDPGAGSLSSARDAGISMRNNTAVFVSHNHINHANDVNAVIDAMTYGGFDKKGVLVSNNTAVNGSNVSEPFLKKRYRDFLERYIVLNAGQRVGINEVEVKALKALHSDPAAIGFKFFTPEFTLSYTGDTKYSAELIEEYKGSNIIILNMPYLEKRRENEGLCREDAIKILKEVKPRLAIITHFGAEMLKADPIYEVREMQKEGGCRVIAAKDGTIVNPTSYSAERGQRTLFGYRDSEGEKQQDIRVYNYNEVKEVDEMVEKEE